MLNFGKIPAGSTIYVPFSTFAGDTGASITLTGLATSDILIYKNGNVTQRSSTAGYALLDTDGIDFDGITGLHGFSIDLSDNTDSGFYAVGSSYWVAVSAVTVDGQTVNFWAATFRIGPAESITGHDKVDMGGIGGDAQSMADLKDFADAGYDPSTNKVQGVVLVDTLTTYTGNTPQTADHTANIAAILADTGTDGVVVAAGSKTGYSLTNLTVAASTTLGTGTHAAQTGDSFALANGASGFVATKSQTAAIETDTQDIQSRLPAALVNSRMDSTIDDSGMEAGAVAAIAFAILEYFGATLGTVEDDAGNSASVFQTSMAEEADDYYVGSALVFTSGTNANQVRKITAYAGSTGTITVSPAFDAEPGTDQFTIVGRIE